MNHLRLLCWLAVAMAGWTIAAGVGGYSMESEVSSGSDSGGYSEQSSQDSAQSYEISSGGDSDDEEEEEEEEESYPGSSDVSSYGSNSYGSNSYGPQCSCRRVKNCPRLNDCKVRNIISDPCGCWCPRCPERACPKYCRRPERPCRPKEWCPPAYVVYDKCACKCPYCALSKEEVKQFGPLVWPSKKYGNRS